jgi:hypothetical protein
VTCASVWRNPSGDRRNVGFVANPLKLPASLDVILPCLVCEY